MGTIDKSVSRRTAEIQERFFRALDTAIALGKIRSVRDFCARHSLNRTRYSVVRGYMKTRDGNAPYKYIDLEAIAALCDDFDVSADWIINGRGKMLNQTKGGDAD